MVRHVEFGAAALDSGALAEGVWEYVSGLVMSYRSQESLQDLEPYKVIFFLSLSVYLSIVYFMHPCVLATKLFCNVSCCRGSFVVHVYIIYKLVCEWWAVWLYQILLCSLYIGFEGFFCVKYFIHLKLIGLIVSSSRLSCGSFLWV